MGTEAVKVTSDVAPTGGGTNTGDVTTTGATLLEARKILILMGARSVECIALAH